MNHPVVIAELAALHRRELVKQAEGYRAGRRERRRSAAEPAARRGHHPRFRLRRLLGRAA